jgi:hypothetical protein
LPEALTAEKGVSELEKHKVEKVGVLEPQLHMATPAIPSPFRLKPSCRQNGVIKQHEGCMGLFVARRRLPASLFPSKWTEVVCMVKSPLRKERLECLRDCLSLTPLHSVTQWNQSLHLFQTHPPQRKRVELGPLLEGSVSVRKSEDRFGCWCTVGKVSEKPLVRTVRLEHSTRNGHQARIFARVTPGKPSFGGNRPVPSEVVQDKLEHGRTSFDNGYSAIFVIDLQAFFW